MKIWDIKLEAPEKVTTMAEVAAAIFASNPTIYNKGTTKLPPSSANQASKNPRTAPALMLKTIFFFVDKAPLSGFHPLSISMAADL